MFQTDIDSAWTFRGQVCRTQVDYILVSGSLTNKLFKSGVFDLVDIGSEHRAVRATFISSERYFKKPVAARKNLRNFCIRDYKVALDSKLSTITLSSTCSSMDSDARSHKLEQAMVLSAESAQPTGGDRKGRDVDLCKIRALISERRRNCALKGTEYYKQLCKQIQKLTRRRDRSLKTAKIKHILDSFCGLKKIEKIKANGRSQGISRIVSSDGTNVIDKQDIADVFASFYEDLY